MGRFLFLLITNLTHFSFSVYLFHFSTCFEQPSARHQENQLYQYIIWYISYCVGDCLVCRWHTRQSPTQSDIYQMMYWYNWFSWWWALGCSKHVEKWNKYIQKEKCVKLVINKNWTEMQANKIWNIKYGKGLTYRRWEEGFKENKDRERIMNEAMSPF